VYKNLSSDSRGGVPSDCQDLVLFNLHTTSWSLPTFSGPSFNKHEQSGDYNLSLVIPDGARYERDIGVRLYSAAYGTQKRIYMSFSNLNAPSQPELFRFTEGIPYNIHDGVASLFFLPQ
jgi:hypothetical protein